MLEGVEIRRAGTEDITSIALLGRFTFGETFGHHFKDLEDLRAYYDQTFSIRKLKNSFQNPYNVFWIALADLLPVGYAKLKLNSPSPFITSKNTCQLQKIYVLKDFISMGIGARLQQQVLEKAVSIGFDKIWLSVLDRNERAQHFYLKNKFEHIGSHDFDIGKEHFKFKVMSRQLI